MLEYMKIWIARLIVEAGAVILLLLLLAFTMFLIYLPGILKQRRCPHERVNETQACDAICRECGKNLGFIQNWRDAQAAKHDAAIVAKYAKEQSAPAVEPVTKSYVEQQKR